MSGIFRVTRRDFLVQAGLGAGALMFGCHLPTPQSLFDTAIDQVDKIFHEGFPLSHFVGIHLDGTVVVMSFRSEMGQGIRSSLAAVLADELEADWSRVRIQQADADGPRYAIQNLVPGGKPSFLVTDEAAQFADSSRSMAIYFPAMRAFGAGIRIVFLRAAAKLLGGTENDYEAIQHKVRHKVSGHSIDYRHLLLIAATVKPLPTQAEAEAKQKDPKDWRFIENKNTPMPFVDAKDMVTGKAVYGADVDPSNFGLTHISRPPMLTAMIVRCPVANGWVKSFDPTPALGIPGVKSVKEVLPQGFPPGGVGMGFFPHAGVAVVAENTWAALQGKRALKVEWGLDGNPNADYDTTYKTYKNSQTGYRHELKKSTDNPGRVLRNLGNVDGEFGPGARVVEADYYVPHLAQTPMEPPAAVALFENDHMEIWSSTQGPELTQHYVGVAMMEPTPANTLRALAWQVIDPSELKEEERELQRDFNDELGRLMGGKDLNALLKVSEELKIEIRSKVTVHVTLLGGGFGRKSKPDYAIEAALLARQHPGVPIRVQWTREDDIQFSYFHAISHQHLKAALDGDGKATAWLQRSAFPSFFATLFPPPDSMPEPLRPLVRKARAAFHDGGEYLYGSAIERAHGLEDVPFKVPNLRIENCPAPSHIRGGWMRSVSNIFHGFSIGSFVDEMAIEAKRDCKDYLLELIGEHPDVNGKPYDLNVDLKAQGVNNFDNNGFPTYDEGEPVKVLIHYPNDTSRLRGVVKLVAKESGWEQKVKQYKGMKGRGLGIAAHRSFLSYVATVIDVSLNDNVLTINDIYTAIDCGIAVNVDRVNAQLEGGVNYGLSIALLGEISVKGGAVQQHNFDDYPVLRIHQTPKIIHMYIMPRTLPPTDPRTRPTGVGEVGVPTVAPALANAIVAAGGPRMREIPFSKFVEVL
jgi:isoquinoline 1-oxidoreductase beta subunit